MASSQQIKLFQQTVWQHYKAHGRALPWREDPSPYNVLVSELMLQQTQVPRVLPKFEQFMRQFPTIQELANAPLGEVLRTWNGLGYNRRAKFLHQTAGIIVGQHGGHLPQTVTELSALPGIGRNTAGAILAYAFNRPALFIETNIRTVYIHHFFPNKTGVNDADITDLLTRTLDHQNPRHWYWALMDIGTHIKQNTGNNIQRSRQYTRQSPFKNSRRQVRGAVIRELLAGPQTTAELATRINDLRLTDVLAELQAEGLVTKRAELLGLSE